MDTTEITTNEYNELRWTAIKYGKLRGACSKIVVCWAGGATPNPIIEKGHNLYHELDDCILELIDLLKEE